LIIRGSERGAKKNLASDLINKLELPAIEVVGYQD